MGTLYVYYPYYIIPACVALFFLLARKIPMSPFTWKTSLWCAGIALIFGAFYEAVILYQHRDTPLVPQLVFHLPSNTVLYAFFAFWLGFLPATIISLFKKKRFSNARAFRPHTRIVAWLIGLTVAGASLLLGYGENLKHTLLNEKTDAATLRALARNAIVRRDTFHQKALVTHPHIPAEVLDDVFTDEAIDLDARLIALQKGKMSCQTLYRVLSIPRSNIADLRGMSPATREKLAPEMQRLSLFVYLAIQKFTDQGCASLKNEELEKKS